MPDRSIRWTGARLAPVQHQLGRPVGAAVVDHQHVDPRVGGQHPVQHLDHRLGLVVGGDDHQASWLAPQGAGPARPRLVGGGGAAAPQQPGQQEPAGRDPDQGASIPRPQRTYGVMAARGRAGTRITVSWYSPVSKLVRPAGR